MAAILRGPKVGDVLGFRKFDDWRYRPTYDGFRYCLGPYRKHRGHLKRSVGVMRGCGRGGFDTVLSNSVPRFRGAVDLDIQDLWSIRREGGLSLRP